MRRYDDGSEKQESSYGGFQYRWNYDEYQKSLQKKRKKTAAGGMRAFFLTTAFVFAVCFLSLAAVLVNAVMRQAAEQKAAGNASRPDYTDIGERLALPDESTTTPGQADASAPNDTISGLGQDNAEPSYAGDAQAGVLAVSDGDAGDAKDKIPENDIAVEKQPESPTALALQMPSLVTALPENGNTAYTATGFVLTPDGYIAAAAQQAEVNAVYRVTFADGTDGYADCITWDGELALALLRLREPGTLTVAEVDDTAPDTWTEDVLTVYAPIEDVSPDGQIYDVGKPGSVIYGEERQALTKTLSLEDGLIAYRMTDGVPQPGSPLLNEAGSVVGISTARIYDTDILCAHSMHVVYPTLTAWIADDRAIGGVGTLAQPWLGGKEDELASTEPVDENTESLPPEESEVGVAVLLGIVPGTVSDDEAGLYRIPAGVLIRSVEASSNAELAGLMTDDILLSVDGVSMRTAEDFQVWERTAVSGRETTFTYYRNGAEFTVRMKLVAPAEDVVPAAPDAGTVPESDTSEVDAANVSDGTEAVASLDTADTADGTQAEDAPRDSIIITDERVPGIPTVPVVPEKAA